MRPDSPVSGSIKCFMTGDRAVGVQLQGEQHRATPMSASHCQQWTRAQPSHQSSTRHHGESRPLPGTCGYIQLHLQPVNRSALILLHVSI